MTHLVSQDKKQFVLVEGLQYGIPKYDALCAHETGDISVQGSGVHALVDFVNAAALNAGGAGEYAGGWPEALVGGMGLRYDGAIGYFTGSSEVCAEALS